MIFDIPKNSKLLLAISGGPDSIYLLHKISQIQKKKNFSLHVAHLNHNTRGNESNLDQKFVENISTKLSIPISTNTLKVQKLNSSKTHSSEDYLRKKRYSFLEKIRTQNKADFIVTAHHLDDQIETIIFNFIRGTGPTGLTGMQFQQGHILRPLLNTSKKNILAYLKKNNIKYRIDKSNLETKYKRNLIRNKILPLFKKINPNPTKSISSLKNILESQNNYIKLQTYLEFKNIYISSQISIKNWFNFFYNNSTLDTCFLKLDTSILLTLSLPKFKSLHHTIQTEIIKNIIQPHVPTNKQLTSKSITEVVNILNHSQGGSKKILFNTLSISKKNDKIYLHILHKK